MTTREDIIEVVNKLFVYTDSQNWNGLTTEVFEKLVQLDMTSLDGPRMDTTAGEICEIWKQGFKDLDAVNHLGGNCLISLVSDDVAEVFPYVTATHFKGSAKNGTTREFVEPTIRTWSKQMGYGGSTVLNII